MYSDGRSRGAGSALVRELVLVPNRLPMIS